MECPLDALNGFGLVRELLIIPMNEHARINLEHDDGAVTRKRAVDAEKIEKNHRGGSRPLQIRADPGSYPGGGVPG